MLVLIVLIVFYLLVLLIGKYASRMSTSSYFPIAIITLVEVLIVMALLFLKDVPKV